MCEQNINYFLWTLQNQEWYKQSCIHGTVNKYHFVLNLFVQVFRLEVVLKGTDLHFSPAMAELEAIINRLIVCIVEGTHSLPRVINVLLCMWSHLK